MKPCCGPPARDLLTIPCVCAIHHGAAGVRREQGPDAVDELIEGLVLLREQGNRAACYWLCPVCEQKFHSSRDFLGHVELVHEGLAVQVRHGRCTWGCGHAQGARSARGLVQQGRQQ